jgi:hypothetical protein
MKYKVEIARQSCEIATVVVDINEFTFGLDLHDGILRGMQPDELFALAATRFGPSQPVGPYVDSITPTDENTPADVELTELVPVLRRSAVLEVREWKKRTAARKSTARPRRSAKPKTPRSKK